MPKLPTNGNGIGKAKREAPPMTDMPEQIHRVTIPAPDIRTLAIDVQGTAPLMVHRFGKKALDQMIAKQKEGSTSGKGKKREPRDFDAAFEDARHRSVEGWDGFPAGALRSAMISACRLVGFKMTLAKLSVFVLADGIDKLDGTPLVKINGGEPERNTMPARNETGVVDVRVRPMWREWSLKLRVQYDADQFTPTDVVNLLQRAGVQVGIGEGRPDSKKSTGMGLGTFRVIDETVH